ncbi:MAG: SRPBCC family protein [Bacteroidia bacterium]|nr:SRPBCC family protein [Bacteroidia bacterium]
MKFIKYFFITIFALIVLFFAMGFIQPVVEYGHTIKVDKPIEEAWAVSEDIDKYDQWLDGFKSMELISGEHGEVGSKYKIIVNPGEGQEDFEMIETVVSKKEFDHIEMHFDNEAMDFYQKISYSENDGTTTISTDSKVDGKSLTMRSMFAWMELLMNAFEKQEAKNMEALKVLIEENTTDYYPEPEPEVEMETDSLSVSF